MGYGERIRQGRKRLGLTQRQLARRLGATDGYISHLEKGLRVPSWEFAVGLARVLELSEEQTRTFLDDIEMARLERARRRSDSRARAVGAGPAALEGRPASPTLRLLDLGDGQVVSLSSESPVRCVAIAETETLVGGSADGLIRFWGLDGELRHTLPGHEGPVAAIAVSPDGRTAASGGEDGLLRIWRAVEGAERCTVPGESSVTALAFSRDGQIVAAGYADGAVRSWEVASGAERRSLATHGGAVRALAFAPDGQLLASGNGGVALWNREGQAMRVLRGLGAGVRALAFSHDGALLAGGSEDQDQARVWEVPDGREVYELAVSGAGVVAVGFSSDDDTLMTVSDDGQAAVWNTATGSWERSVYLALTPLESAALSPAGTTVLASGRALATDSRARGADLEADPSFRAAYRDLLAAYASPNLRDAVVQALRGFAQAAEASHAAAGRAAAASTSSPGMASGPDRG